MKPIAFYLPQYHPIPENDAWWGRGFTEWTNVARSRPRFRGHYQPHIPADTGFYDLRCQEIRSLQAALASSHGIYGFCYYHYWFHGRRLLHRPIDDILTSGTPNFPFCFCWANESWTRSWDGKTGEILIQQQHSAEDNLDHIDWLLPIFKDDRYIKINGCPLFLIYRTDIIPRIAELLFTWRQRAKMAGFPDLYLCAVRSNFCNAPDETLLASGFNALIDFQPANRDFPKRSLAKRALRYLKKNINAFAKEMFPALQMNTTIRISYDKLMANSLLRLQNENGNVFPCVIPNWDNCPRKQDCMVIQNDDPDKYGAWLDAACSFVQDRYPQEERLLFINAWNEWGEGAHLEPDLRYGDRFLEITKLIVSKY